MGLGATQAVAMDIFGGLKNSSSYSSDSSDGTADISASINILSVMARGSKNVDLDEEVFPVSPQWLLLLFSVKHQTKSHSDSSSPFPS